MDPLGDEVKEMEDRARSFLAGNDSNALSPEEFLSRRFDEGLAWVWFPAGYGGLGVSPALQAVVDEVMARAGAPDPFARNPIGWGMGAPTIVSHGSEDQKARYLRRLFTAEEIWCQLFSEPGAGSDVASLSTSAVRDGERWIVNGQKVWTSYAHVARWGMLLARTDPEQPKHKGLTYFVIDMQAPGVEVRPLRQMSGEAQFNEVFLSDVEIPDSERLGEEGEGWRVALTTLMNERVSLGGAVRPRGSGHISAAVDLYRGRCVDNPVIRDRLVRLWIDAEVLRLTNMRAAELRAAGTPGPEGSIGKLATAELTKRISELSVTMLGPEGMCLPPYEESRVPLHPNDPRWLFLRSRGYSIEGGTTEVMRNILGERVLGLPADGRGEKDRPWNQSAR